MPSYLSDKVRKQTLPVFNTAPGAKAPVAKRLLLPQGELAAFYDSDEAIRYLAFIELWQGTVRGNHYHKIKREWIYVLDGEVDLALQDLESGAQELVQIKTGDLVDIAPGVAHALRVTRSGQAIEFSPTRFDASDIYRHPLN